MAPTEGRSRLVLLYFAGPLCAVLDGRLQTLDLAVPCYAMSFTPNSYRFNYGPWPVLHTPLQVFQMCIGVCKTCVFLLVYRPSLLLAVTNVSYRRNLDHFVSIEQTSAPEKSLVRNSPGQMSAQWKRSALNFYGCA